MTPVLRVVGLTLGILLTGPVASQERSQDSASAIEPLKPIKPNDTQKSACSLLEYAARANGLPVEFFARLIWQESRFRADAMGPITRSGKRALGIAQFMPGTAAERNLQNPLDPVQALPKSAEFLRDLRGEFGNLGLAAAAYNAGPRRVREWMAGSGSMPLETRNYVIAITGAPIEQWSKAGADADPIQETGLGCGELMALLDRPPNRFVAALEKRPIAGVMQSRGVITGVDMSRARTLGKYSEIQARDAAVLAGKDPILLEPGRGPPPRYQVRFVNLSRPYLNEGGPPGATFKVVTPPRAIASLSSRMP